MWEIEEESASHGDILHIDRLGPRHWQGEAGGARVEGSRLVFVLIGCEAAMPGPMPPVPTGQTTRLGRALERYTRRLL